MKQLLQFVAVIVIAVCVPLAVSVPASAQEVVDCEISNTGPESENECEVEETFTCEIDNENNVTIINSQEQQAASGNAAVGQNGTGGAAISGSASNDSSVVFNVEITNGEGEDRLCAVVGVTPTPEPQPEPETPENPVQPAPKPKALPVTSSDAPIALLSVGGLVAVAGIVALYRRLYL